MGKADEPAPAAGVYAAILTPRNDDSTDTNVSAFLEYIDRICRAHVNGIVLFGSTGEFVHYDLDERMRVVSLGVKRSRVPVLVNVSHSSLRGAVDLAQQAESAQAAGVLLMPPYFYRYEDSEIERFYFDFLAQAGLSIPVYLYNLPVYTNALSPALKEKFLGSGKFAGIKDSSGSWTEFEALLSLRARRPFQALVGNESIYADGLRAGVDGVVSGVAAAIPELLVLIQAAFARGDLEAKQRLIAQLDEFLVWVGRFPASVAIKYAADFRGWLPAQLAVPLGPEATDLLQEFRAWLSDWLPAVRT